MGKPFRTLYICYFGLREPLVQTQVLPYLRQLQAGGAEVYLLTFETEPQSSLSQEVEMEWREKLLSVGIRWHWRTYHKTPSLPATLYDIAVGAGVAAKLVRREHIAVLHGRAHVATAMGALAKRMTGTKLIFDIRGFNPEEYVDAGTWPANGRNFRLMKRAERKLLEYADGFVVLTERAREILWPGCSERDARGRPLAVIPCCVDIERFESSNAITKDQSKRELGVQGRQVFAYVGALGGWYLTDEMADFLAAAHRRNRSTYSMILTQSPPEALAVKLDSMGIGPDDRLIRKVDPQEIPRYLNAADIALSLIKPCYSKQASSPTKLAEYLACGLPVVCNAGIGDVDRVVLSERMRVVLDEFNGGAYEAALGAVEALCADAGLADRCRAAARSHFDLRTVGGERYRGLYERLLASE